MKNLVSESLNEFNKQYMDKPVNHPDLSKVKGSVTKTLEDLIPALDSYSTVDALKNDFIAALEASSISPAKKKRYLMDLAKMNSMARLQEFITNVYLKGSNLGLR
jgi:hypothetical protein